MEVGWMKYTYTKNGKHIQVWYSDFGGVNAPFGTVCDIIGDSKYIPVRVGANNELEFTWTDGETYKLNDFECYTPAEIVELIKNNSDRVYEEDVCKTLLKYGVESINFIIKSAPIERFGPISIKSGRSEDTVAVKCRVIEEFNRELIHAYKVKLEPINEMDKMSFGCEEFYWNDFVSLLKKVDGFDLEVA